MRLSALLMIPLLFAVTSCLIDRDVVKKPQPLSDLTEDDNDEPYLIGVGDELEIKFYFLPDMNDVTDVRPDGKISVMFAKDVQAAGKTADELTEDIRRKISPFVKEPDVSVTVNDFGSQRVYVGGEVVKPGPIQLSKRSSLTQVLGEAGWLTPLASTHEIVIIRRNEDGKESVYHVNPSQIVSGEDTEQDVTILAGDVILVPPSGAVAYDRWIDQNIRLALPFNTSAGYIYSNNATSAGLFR